MRSLVFVLCSFAGYLHVVLAQPFHISTYIHVIAKSIRAEDGNIQDSMLNIQMDVLNQDFTNSNAGISFTLAGVDRTINVDWSTYKNPEVMKKTLRRGGAADLNIYYLSDMGDMLINCTMPADYADNPSLDGCIILGGTLPGGTMKPYNLGRTTTEGAGRWAGLYPTSQGGCAPPGDFVDDTPSEVAPAYGCPEGRNTCPNRPGGDPIHNFMDSTDDACRNNFTPGQAARMSQQLTTYRGV